MLRTFKLIIFNCGFSTEGTCALNYAYNPFNLKPLFFPLHTT